MLQSYSIAVRNCDEQLSHENIVLAGRIANAARIEDD